MLGEVFVWIVCLGTVLAILVRPRRIPEYVWALCGASLLIVFGSVPVNAAASAIGRGFQVYLFLVGLLALAELARLEGVFTWLSGRALWAAGHSKVRLFTLIYGIGVVVTALLSNDATAVVLTPAVFAVLARTDVRPLPYLYGCAFVSNAASFLLPIGNPANLLVFAKTLPPLIDWLGAFLIPSVLAIVATYAVLWLLFRTDFSGRLNVKPPVHEHQAGRGPAFVIISISCALLAVVAALGRPIGTFTFLFAAMSLAVVAFADRGVGLRVVRNMSWGIVPLVAGLFVIVQALNTTGALVLATRFVAHAATLPEPRGNVLAGLAVTIADAIFNNLPVGVIAAFSLQHAPAHIVHAALIGVDLGPNLSVTGSLATLLWMGALRSNGVSISPWHFLGVGSVVVTPALLLALMTVR